MYTVLFASFCFWSLFGFALGCSLGTHCNVHVRTSGSKSGWMTVKETFCSVYRKEEEQKPSLGSLCLHVVLKINYINYWSTICYNFNVLGNIKIVWFFSEYPRVEVFPTDVSQMAGSDATVLCNASGSPTPELSWTLNSSEHPPLSTSHEVTLCLLVKYKWI